MTVMRVDGVSAPLGIYPESLSVEKPTPLGLASVKDSSSTDRSAKAVTGLFSPPQLEYECIEVLENLSCLVKDSGKLVIKEFKVSEEEFQKLLKEKALVMKDLLEKAESARSYDYLKDLTSYAMVICNFVLGSFLMSSEAAEAITPAAFFMAAAALSAAGIAMKESSSWKRVAAMWAGDDEELKKLFEESAPLALLAIAGTLAGVAGGVGAMSPELFSDLSISQDTLSLLQQGMGIATTTSASASGIAKVRHGLAKTGLAEVQDNITSVAKTQEKSLSFFTNIKQGLKNCCSTIQQMIKQRSFV